MDYGSRYAEKRLNILELRLKRTYKEAEKDILKKIEQFTEKKEEKANQLLEKVKKGEISEQEYKNWLAGQAFIGERWQAKLDEITHTLQNVNEQALATIRKEQYDIYAENANYEAYEIEKDVVGYSFDLYDKEMVEWLVDEKPELLRPRTINGKKDRAWNQGIMSNCVSQGIIQGESIRDIAKRIARDTSLSDMKAATRYARTATTYAMNAGKLDSIRRANEMGIHTQKMWVAKLDSRTRDAHRSLDGQIQEWNKPFESDLGLIMEPGHPDAQPANIYNCRCGMRRVYADYAHLMNRERRAYAEYVDDNGKTHKESYIVKNMTYNEWVKIKQEKDNEALENWRKKNGHKVHKS